MKLGILGGTFDPIHFAHLRLAEEIRELAALEHVVFMPAQINPLKRDTPATPAHHRVEMLRAALAGRDDYEIDERELRRDGPSYTIDTLRALRAERPHDEFVLILGMDAFRLFGRWKSWSEIVTLAHLVVAGRPGEQRLDPRSVLSIESPDRLWYDQAEDKFHFKSGLSLTFCETTPLSISATDIRRRVSTGRSIRYLTPDPVIQYIQQHQLYKE